ncbi:MAG: PD-(D/E)XK nuclease family protein, partial [Gammaproteobacteria bacterium]|nr:PD-(D/E)XK nuclease family protein [Gammaproteobacteria bacterium]MDE0269570.1 PD-(D/E)XK nuclease family protein [Gammaproteobacteria bacterium]
MERTIAGQRRIDIYVEVPSGKTRYGLAIENKPYADDQYEQVKDYLKHLKERTNLNEFHLIYLSPTGEPPSKESLPKAEFENWRGRLLIMPYHHRHTDEDWTDREGKRDEFRDFRTLASLTQWLADCRAQCEAQRLRWFLGDAESYCRRTFGDTDMASDLETKTVLELLESEPNH